MNPKRIRTAIAASIGMLLLILDSRTALDGAAEGLEICITTIIPSLLPFFVLSILLTGCLSGQEVPILRPLGRLTGMPAGSESILLTGLLGGYPVGAQAIAAAHTSGAITDSEAARMMAFCNNAGPSFIFGITASLFPDPRMGWALWGIHIAGAILIAMLLPGKSHRRITLPHAEATSLPAAVSSALRVMASVCGWVVIFRVILSFLERWFFWILPKLVQVSLTGLLELANGCCSLASIGNAGERFVLCSALLAFGGLCVMMQTASVAAGVNRRLYFPGKLLQTAFSILLSLPLQCLLPAGSRMHISLWIPLILLSIPAFFLLSVQKSSSIPAKAGV